MIDIGEIWQDAMRAGHYETAWTVAANILQQRDPASRDDPSLPFHQRWVWDGSPPDGRQVLVRCYHGLGDTIQFARYLPVLARRAGRVSFEVQPRLRELLAGLNGIDQSIAFDPAAPEPKSECDIEITELDLVLRIPPEAAPPPYIAARHAELPPGTVALCHASGEWDRDRDLPADLFRSLTRIAPCITLVPAPSTLDVLNPQGCPFDMGITASLIAGAELVITVDTMIAHLSGAMGKPTWLLIKAAPDWRWDPGSVTSSWYPSMRIYAQPEPGDWKTVMAHVSHDLAHIRRRSRKG
ncbi:glycosyltransferase family 9 protein [Flavisphingomonas formosensis]|uniref:glycosyltransferase family 9 protein n=1 Tax=Flavisphingomonas formosensis TaxID=861534 RepID=UPI0012F7A68C|nr:hypothetical protein [Sphingomonas formosensis]